MKSFIEELYSENLKNKNVMKLSLRVEFVEFVKCALRSFATFSRIYTNNIEIVY